MNTTTRSLVRLIADLPGTGTFRKMNRERCLSRLQMAVSEGLDAELAERFMAQITEKFGQP